jgi:hypothetical protein
MELQTSEAYHILVDRLLYGGIALFAHRLKDKILSFDSY